MSTLTRTIVLAFFAAVGVARAQAPAFPSVNFNGLKQVALVANVTTGTFVNLGGSLPQPPGLFNVKL